MPGGGIEGEKRSGETGRGEMNRDRKREYMRDKKRGGNSGRERFEKRGGGASRGGGREG